VNSQVEMGILLHPYNPAVYNRLPHFELATKQAADVGVTSKLDQLGQIFVKHDTFRLFGLIIIHRHFDMTNKEILVDSLAEDKLSSIAMPWNLNGKDKAEITFVILQIEKTELSFNAFQVFNISSCFL